MNQYPFWKYLLVVGVLALGCFFALPNIYGSDPAVQVSPVRGAAVDASLETRALEHLKTVGLEPSRVELGQQNLLLRFSNEEDQLRARDELVKELGREYVVALNLAPSTPSWLDKLGVLPMYLGLDLRGGVHFLMEVDMNGAVHQAEARNEGDIRSLLRENKLRYASLLRRETGGIVIEFNDVQTMDQAYDLIRRELPDLVVEKYDQGGKLELRASLSERAAADVKEFALQQNITTLRNRVNELGVAEPVIQREGQDRIVVQLPGVQDTARAKEILGATATLEFRMVDTEHSVQEALAGRVPPTAKLFYERGGGPILLKRSVMLTGDYITNAAAGIDQQTGQPDVTITLDGKGARLFSTRTRDQIGRPMAVVFIENKTETVEKDGEVKKRRYTQEEVINVATIRDQLGKRFHITGLDTTTEARNLALLLRAGSLAAPIEIIEERTVGPSLGRDNIEQGFNSVIIAFVAVLVFMAVYYKVFGLAADLALTFNLIMIVGVLSMLQATLTLPGIAGIVLTTGMAVDANVLIYERIREEIRNGNSPHASIAAGYEKAFSTIADANITTLIAAVVLFGFGTGPIKGFAITLSIGIVTSMFTAIMGTRAVVSLIYGGRRLKRLSI